MFSHLAGPLYKQEEITLFESFTVWRMHGCNIRGFETEIDLYA